MFEDFYELSGSPFARNISTEQLFERPEYSEALSRLKTAAARQWFAILTGDCGTGKSTVLRKLSNMLSEKEYKVLYLADSQLTPRHFYNGLLEQLGVQGKFYRGDSRKLLHHEVDVLYGVYKRKPVVICDEAHLLDREMLEEIRFLLNQNMDSQSSFSLILSGQTEFLEKLRKQHYTAVRQRVDITCHLPLLDESGTALYIRHHLKEAGARQEIFTDNAISEIYRYSAGNPRIINKVCTHSLVLGNQHKKKIIDDYLVRSVLETEMP